MQPNIGGAGSPLVPPPQKQPEPIADVTPKTEETGKE